MELKEHRELFEEARQGIDPIYKEILNDKRFYQGEGQWYKEDKDSRRSKEEPYLTINSTKRYVKRVTNDARKNKPQIKIIPAGYGADKETAKVCDGLIRRIRNNSRAKAAYNTAQHSATAYGLGYFRIDVEYISDFSMDQDLFINRIRNEQQVTWYLDEIQEFDFSDAENCWIEHSYPVHIFEKKFPGVAPISFQSDKPSKSPIEKVTIQEHFEVIHKPQKLYIMGIEGDPTIQHPVFQSDLDGFMKKAERSGAGTPFILDERDSEKRYIKKEYLNGEGSFNSIKTVFRWIPIVTVIGEEYDIDGELQFDGMVRSLKDPNRQLNFWRTAAVINVALAGKPKHIGPLGFMGDRDAEWKASNRSDDAVLEYDVQYDKEGRPLPPPQFVQFNDIPAASLSLAAQADEDFKRVTGIQDPALGVPMSGQSGYAENQMRQESDTANYDYVDNMSIALTHAGRIMVDALPKIHNMDNEPVTILEESGEERDVTINRTTKDKDTNSFLRLGGEYSVVVTVGPGYATRRQESQASMREFITRNPEMGRFIMDLYAKTEDWDNSDEFAERFQALIAQEHPEFFQNNKQLEPGQVMAVMQQNKQLQQMMQQLKAQLEDKTTEQQLEKYKIDAGIQEEVIKVKGKADTEALKSQSKLIETQIKAKTDLVKASITRKVDIQ